jgi:DNA-binding transcriptional LysR family regulator
MKITSEELQTFISIIDTGSISGAADQLNQTSSGISRALTRLEKKLHTTLLRRTTRRMQLTDEGQTFLDQARSIVSAMEKAEQSMTEYQGTPSGILRVDSASPFILHSIAPYMDEFLQLYPAIKLQLVSSERIIDLLEKKVDVAIRIGVLQDSTLHAKLLGHSRLRIVASPGYLKKYGTPKTVQELSEHRLLGFTSPSTLNHWPLKNAGGNSYSANINLTASSGETLLQLAKNDAGIACLSDFMTLKDLEEKKLVQILKNQTAEFKQPINAVYYKETQASKKISAFTQFLKTKLYLPS